MSEQPDATEATLRDALKPFAEAAESLDETDKDDWNCWEHHVAMDVTIGDFRRALAALSPTPRLAAQDKE